MAIIISSCAADKDMRRRGTVYELEMRHCFKSRRDLLCQLRTELDSPVCFTFYDFLQVFSRLFHRAALFCGLFFLFVKGGGKRRLCGFVLPLDKGKETDFFSTVNNLTLALGNTRWEERLSAFFFAGFSILCFHRNAIYCTSKMDKKKLVGSS
jgi:hypothetical protein